MLLQVGPRVRACALPFQHQGYNGMGIQLTTTSVLVAMDGMAAADGGECESSGSIPDCGLCCCPSKVKADSAQFQNVCTTSPMVSATLGSGCKICLLYILQ